MSLKDRVKQFFKVDEVHHWGDAINAVKQSQSVNHYSFLCQIKALSEKIEGLKSDQKQTMDLLFLHAESSAKFKTDILELKRQLKKIKKIPKQKKNGDINSTGIISTK